MATISGSNIVPLELGTELPKCLDGTLYVGIIGDKFKMWSKDDKVRTSGKFGHIMHGDDALREYLKDNGDVPGLRIFKLVQCGEVAKEELS